MLTQPLIEQLHELRLRGMAAALEQQGATPDRSALSFEERLGLMIQHERTERASARLAQRLRWASAAPRWRPRRSRHGRRARACPGRPGASA